MFRILKNPDFDFMGKGRAVLMISLVLVLACVLVLVLNGLNLGIEFTGGTELQLRFVETPNIASLRAALNGAGWTNNTVTTIGDPAGGEIYIRLGAQSEQGGSSEDITSEVVHLLRTTVGGQDDKTRDLNVVDQASIERLLFSASHLSPEQASSLAAALSERRKERGIFRSVQELSGVEGMTEETLEFLQRECVVGPLALRSQSYIGPAIGHELLNKALFAVLGSLAGMLIYIWIRFHLEWGFAAVVALTHDTLITLGLFSFFGREMSLPVVAAFLTLIGYSVNDTVVVFDRIRENVRVRSTESLGSNVNLAINQTLSRTIITSGLTWIVVTGLFIFGGTALRSFAFVLTVGVIVGTYSSIYVASPFLLLWRQLLARRVAHSGAPSRRSRAKAKKIRTGSAS